MWKLVPGSDRADHAMVADKEIPAAKEGDDGSDEVKTHARLWWAGRACMRVGFLSSLPSASTSLSAPHWHRRAPPETSARCSKEMGLELRSMASCDSRYSRNCSSALPRCQNLRRQVRVRSSPRHRGRSKRVALLHAGPPCAAAPRRTACPSRCCMLPPRGLECLAETRR